MVDAIGAGATWYKVGSVLAVSDGPALVRELRARGKTVFLDLKWHDIPNTVAGAVAAAASLGVSLATVHLAGGRAMLEAAAAARRGTGLRLVGVGVLTSMDAAEFGAVVGRPVADVSDEQARLAHSALGVLDGFVTAVAEAPRLRALAGEGAFLVTPGIRRSGEPRGDQVRTATPAEAARAGSDLLVVGRPVTGAGDPGEVFRAMRNEVSWAPSFSYSSRRTIVACDGSEDRIRKASVSRSGSSRSRRAPNCESQASPYTTSSVGRGSSRRASASGEASTSPALRSITYSPRAIPMPLFCAS